MSTTKLYLIYKNEENILLRREEISNLLKEKLKCKMPPAYNFKFNKNSCFILSYFDFDCTDLPFPDFRNIRNFDFTELLKKICPGQLYDNEKCPKCGAAKFTGKHTEYCCGDIENIKNHMISENVPPIILAPIIEYSKISPNFPRNVNRLSRPVLQHSKVNNQYGGNSTVSITGIPYAVDSQKQFMNQVYITFLGYDKILQHNIPGATSVIKAEINVMIRALLNTNKGLKNYVQQCSEPLNKLTEYYAYLKSNDKGANVAVIGNEEITHEIITEAACLKDKFSDGKYKKKLIYMQIPQSTIN